MLWPFFYLNVFFMIYDTLSGNLGSAIFSGLTASAVIVVIEITQNEENN